MEGLKEIQKLKKGEFFKRVSTHATFNGVWVFDGYNRYTRKYSAYSFNDINKFMEFKKGTLVLVDFTF